MAALGGWRALGDVLLRGRNLSLGQQVFGVDEPAARLPETLGGLLLAEPIDIGALFAEAGCKPCEVAVRRDETEAVEPAAVQKVHGVDHQCDVGRVLPTRVGELLVRIDRVFRKDLGPGFQALVREIPIDTPDTCLAELGVRGKPLRTYWRNSSASVVARLDSPAQHDEGLDDFGALRVGLADHRRLHHRRMLDQRAFDVERARSGSRRR